MNRTVTEALQLVVAHSGRQPTTQIDLAEALGLVLASPVVADVDSPPFAKSLVDGYAVRNVDLASGRAELLAVGTLAAGTVADRPLVPGTTYRIMTGAPMPQGADAVVMLERSRVEPTGCVIFDDPQFRANQNVMSQAREFARGMTVLDAGHCLGPAEIGLLAAVGVIRPTVYARPRLAIISTGNELIPPDRAPGSGQIRNSNASTLTALALAAGATVDDLGIVIDDESEIARTVARGLEYDVLVLTGGVSMGDHDLVPGVLRRQGVEQIFHKVDLKPGKPVWFGRHSRGLVFGLPGNPVSVLVCFELFVRTALRTRQGRADPLPTELPARLRTAFNISTARTCYHPARYYGDGSTLEVEPVEWAGSPDLRSVTKANCLLIAPTGGGPFPAGSVMRVLPLSAQ
jgi:molybdopterin molybdotransferase